MTSRPTRAAGWNGWPLAAVAVVGVGAAAFYALDAGNGIAYTPGAYLVVGSTALLILGVLVLLFGTAGWLRKTLLILTLLDLLGTAFAAYLLEAWVLLAIMAIGLIAWLALALSSPGTESGRGAGARWEATSR